MRDTARFSAPGRAVAGARLGALRRTPLGRSVADIAPDRPAPGAVPWVALAGERETVA